MSVEPAHSGAAPRLKAKLSDFGSAIGGGYTGTEGSINDLTLNYAPPETVFAPSDQPDSEVVETSMRPQYDIWSLGVGALRGGVCVSVRAGGVSGAAARNL